MRHNDVKSDKNITFISLISFFILNGSKKMSVLDCNLVNANE